MVSHCDDTKTHAGQNPSPETHLLASGGDGDIKGGVDRIYPQPHVTEENPMAGAGESKPVLNPDWYYTINIARCTKRERRELKERLSWELQQVQSVMRWVDASSAGNPTRLPPKKRRKKVEDRRSESEKGLAAMMRKCLEIVNKLRRQKGANWFNTPVDADRLGLYDYHQFIKTPMDLGTVKEKLSKGSYRCPSEFAADVKLTFDNAMLYNAPDHFVHQLAVQLLNKFQKMYYPAYEVYRKRASDESDEAVLMTDKEKKELMMDLQNLDDKGMNDAIQMMRRRGVKLKTNGDEVEVELEALDNDTLWQLKKHFLLAEEPIDGLNTTTNRNEINITQNKNNSIDNIYNNNKLDAKEKKADSGSNTSSGSSSSNSSSGTSSSSSSSDSEISLVNGSVQETTLPP